MCLGMFRQCPDAEGFCSRAQICLISQVSKFLVRQGFDEVVELASSGELVVIDGRCQKLVRMTGFAGCIQLYLVPAPSSSSAWAPLACCFSHPSKSSYQSNNLIGGTPVFRWNEMPFWGHTRMFRSSAQ